MEARGDEEMMSLLWQDDVHGGKTLCRNLGDVCLEVERSFFFLFCVEQIPLPYEGDDVSQSFLEPIILYEGAMFSPRRH